MDRAVDQPRRRRTQGGDSCPHLLLILRPWAPFHEAFSGRTSDATPTGRGGLEGVPIAPESGYTRVGLLSAVRAALMPQRLLSVTGFVLAGGLSRRMGRPKAALVLGDETMLARQVRLLKSVSRSVAVVGRLAGFEGLEARGLGSAPGGDVRLLPDEFPGRGPLGGIYS